MGKYLEQIKNKAKISHQKRRERSISEDRESLIEFAPKVSFIKKEEENETKLKEAL